MIKTENKQTQNFEGMYFVSVIKEYKKPKPHLKYKTGSKFYVSPKNTVFKFTSYCGGTDIEQIPALPTNIKLVDINQFDEFVQCNKKINETYQLANIPLINFVNHWMNNQYKHLTEK